MKRFSGLLLITALLLAPSMGNAQDVGLAIVTQTFRFDDAGVAGVETFHLTAVPWFTSVPVARRWSLSVGSAYAMGRTTGPDGGEATLSGVTDTDVGVRFAFADWLVLGADATLATGRSALSTQEALVAGVIAADLLPFSINTWGSGGSLGGTFAVATQAGAWGMGFAGGYWSANGFEPLPEAPVSFNPGDQLQARVAFDRDVAGSSTLSIVMGFQHFTDDQLMGANLFTAGSRVQGMVSLAFPVGQRSSALAYGGVNHRSSGTLLLEESQLAGATDSPSQQLFLAGASLRAPLGRRVVLLPRSELRVFRAEDGASQGWVGSAGASMDIRLAGNSAGRRIMLTPVGQFRLGNIIVEEGAESGIVGWEAGLALRVDSGR